MKRFCWNGYETEVDVETTRAWYETSPVWDCDCGHCRNFVQLAKERKLPAEMLELLDELGIPPEKATYVCSYDDKDDPLLYDITYRLHGRILCEPTRPKEFLCHPNEGYFIEGAFPEPFFDRKFWVLLPWVLDEPLHEPIEKRGLLWSIKSLFRQICRRTPVR